MTSGEISIETLASLADRYWLGFMFWLLAVLFFFFLWKLAYRYGEVMIAQKSQEAQKKTPEQLNKLVKHELNVNAGVNAILDEIRKDNDACRVAVMQYHNGWYFNSGSHKTKVSMTHEVVRQGIGSIAKDMQDIPSAIFTHANSRLLAWEDITIIYSTDTGDGNSDEGVVATYKSIGYTSVYAFAIRKHGYLVGKIVVWFFNEVRLSDEELDDIMTKTKQVETLINL